MYKSVEKLLQEVEELLQEEDRTILNPDGSCDLEAMEKVKCICGHTMIDHILGVGPCFCLVPGPAPHTYDLGCHCKEFNFGKRRPITYRKIRRHV